MVVMGEEMYVTGYTKGDLELKYCWREKGVVAWGIFVGWTFCCALKKT